MCQAFDFQGNEHIQQIKENLRVREKSLRVAHRFWGVFTREMVIKMSQAGDNLP